MPNNIKNRVKRFYDDFIEFALDDFIRLHHNKDQSLTYLASELDEHYYTDYLEQLNEYYDVLINNCDEFNKMKVTKLNNDYKIDFSLDIIPYDKRLIPLLTLTNDTKNSIRIETGEYIKIKYYPINLANEIIKEGFNYYVKEEYDYWDTDFNESDSGSDTTYIPINKMNVCVKDNKFYGVVLKYRGMFDSRQFLIGSDRLKHNISDGSSYSGYSCQWSFKENEISCYKQSNDQNSIIVEEHGSFKRMECNNKEKEIVFDSLSKWMIGFEYSSIDLTNNTYYNGNPIGLFPGDIILKDNKLLGIYYNHHAYIIDECMTHSRYEIDEKPDRTVKREYSLIFFNRDIINGLLSVERIDNKCLNLYKQYLEIRLPSYIRAIGKEAFIGNNTLRRLVINEGTEIIESEAIKWCELLSEIILPSSIKEIKKDAFMLCDKNAKIFYKGTKEEFMRLNTDINADVYFYSEIKPNDDNKYWHYENNEPLIW